MAEPRWTDDGQYCLAGGGLQFYMSEQPQCIEVQLFEPNIELAGTSQQSESITTRLNVTMMVSCLDDTEEYALLPISLLRSKGLIPVEEQQQLPDYCRSPPISQPVLQNVQSPMREVEGFYDSFVRRSREDQLLFCSNEEISPAASPTTDPLDTDGSDLITLEDETYYNDVMDLSNYSDDINAEVLEDRPSMKSPMPQTLVHNVFVEEGNGDCEIIHDDLVDQNNGIEFWSVFEEPLDTLKNKFINEAESPVIEIKKRKGRPLRSTNNIYKTKNFAKKKKSVAGVQSPLIRQPKVEDMTCEDFNAVERNDLFFIRKIEILGKNLEVVAVKINPNFV